MPLTDTAAAVRYGKFSDLYGRKALMSIAITLFVVGSVLCGYAVTCPHFLTLHSSLSA